LKAWLLRQPEVGASLMSGSGATVFSVLHPNTHADLLAKRAKELDREIWTHACETL
jgi:4-diphosphocytidyl-2C-methyl-D-erythritol kinase